MIEIDPVCGTPVDATESRENAFVIEFEGREYVSRGARCKDDFTRKPIAYAVAERTAP